MQPGEDAEAPRKVLASLQKGSLKGNVGQHKVYVYIVV